MLKKILFFLILISLSLTSCGAKPASLWGEYSTPTPNGALPTQLPVVLPTQEILPTSTPIEVVEVISTSTPLSTQTPTATSPAQNTAVVPTIEHDTNTILYYSQSGDYLETIASHFGVEIEEITGPKELPSARTLLNPNTLLVIPDNLEETTSNEKIFPDSEVVFSSTAIDFETISYISEKDAFLKEYEEYLGSTGWTSGAEGIARLAQENSLNPRLLVALVEYESGWVLGDPGNLSESDYPLGYVDFRARGLFRQMMRAVQDLALGYYGWRDGTLTELTFPDGSTIRLAPELNAGSVAIMYYFAQKLDYERWAQTVDARVGFPALYAELFDDPWSRAQNIEPLFPAGLKQPTLVLPFEPELQWAYTGGPHSAWEHEGAIAALDFAPNETSGCAETNRWVVASAPGLVVHSNRGVVILDLDGDGNEETGWNLLYLHIATEGRVPVGVWLETNERIGKPSCEGGVSTGTHLHFARKYNGEWILADGALSFNLDGWIAHNGAEPYLGTLTRGDEIIEASVVGDFLSIIFRDATEDIENEE
ncbi:MAG: hypothetical protein HN392_08695 [Anaerolineae bacterium]|jgi:LasA protease|nr:hypothetical protein [Anaerolineae bacterium]MBT7073978.1 hypothetical protein [Anaerolineae bacterium]MBT7783613.1 hypothetical protein [Anaerolineae bacterium]